MAEGDGHREGLGAATRVWARVAALSFGGPAGQIAVMHRIVVEEKRWVGEAQFLHALGFCTLLPGPEAQQLATYLGWLRNGTQGGVLAGGLFVLPGFVSILGLSVVYAEFGGVPWVAAAFFGLKAAVLAVVTQAVLRLARRALQAGVLRALAGAAFVLLFLFGAPFPAVVLGAGALGAWGACMGVRAFVGEALEAAPAAKGGWRRAAGIAAAWLGIWLAPGLPILAWAGASSRLAQVAWFFGRTAVVGFGGAYAVLAYVAQQAVEQYGWLRPGEMLDGLGLAETTPGPLIMVLEFVGFLAAYRDPGGLPPLLAGVLGAAVATWATFAPCFLWVFVGAPYVERLRGVRALQGALRGVTAAVVGVIANLAVWFAVHSLFRVVVPIRGVLHVDAPDLGSLDVAAAALAMAAAVALFAGRVAVPWVLAGSALAGVAMGWVRGRVGP